MNKRRLNLLLAAFLYKKIFPDEQLFYLIFFIMFFRNFESMKFS